MKLLDTASPIAMTAAERQMGRLMRAPDHPTDEGRGIDDFQVELAENGVDKPAEDRLSENQQEPPAKGGERGDAEDEDDDADDKGEEDDETGVKPEKGGEGEQRLPKGVERRLANLTRRLKEQQEENERLRGAPPEKDAQRGQAEDKPEAGKKPVVADFDNYEDFIEAIADWKADERIKADRSSREATNANKDFATRFVEGRKAFPDWDAVVSDDVKVSKAMEEAIKATDNPAAIVYHLSDNSEEADRIRALPPMKQAFEIGKIEAALAKAGAKPEDKPGKKVSEAPEPITPVKAGAKPLGKTVDEMDPDEFIRHQNKKEGIERTY